MYWDKRQYLTVIDKLNSKNGEKLFQNDRHHSENVF